MTGSLEVAFFVNSVSDSSIPLEIATELSDRSVSITVYSFYPPGHHSFDVDVEDLGGSSLFSTGAYRELYQLLERQNPDVLHVHPNATGAVARGIGQFVDVPIIVSTEHGSHENFGWLKNAINGGTNWLSDVVVANSNATERSIRRWERILLDVSRTDIEIIPNGVDVERVNKAAEKKPPETPSGLLIGTVGRLVPVKNQARLVRATAPILRDEEATLLVVGSGPEREKLEKIARMERVSNQVHFLGHLPRDDVYALLHELDVFVFPSKAEGFGVAVVEAMAAGVPPVVSDIPALREVVDDTGEYVDPGDTDDIERGIRKLLADGKKRRSLSERAQDRAKRFTLSKTAEAYLNLYERHLRDTSFISAGSRE